MCFASSDHGVNKPKRLRNVCVVIRFFTLGGTCLEDCWVGVWDMFGTLFGGFGDVLGRFQGHF